ncbi:MAG: hypothetical protein A3I66_10735 [Burkholderiales bacterium RIFCSPLOWO2_02_FULL_57_36]|nr:MAG: hypothetical protein A3I66_10735 [Burkholderiales bacterium RIFCSPLOWO2_02_FULL_57_36]
MKRLTTALLALGLSVFGTGCAMVAPQYTASLENVQILKDSGNSTAKVAEFQASKDKAYANPISIRSVSLASPYDDSYASYLTAALKQELSLAKKLSQDANVEISGTVLKNDIDTSGVSMSWAQVEARFIVKRNGQLRYDQVKSMKHEFPSSFAANVAIPTAILEYPVAVQKLLNQLYTDKAFIEALK